MSIGPLNWRRILIYTHRWLGIAGCLVFLMWFVSGVVMMYARMPRLTAEERLARLAPVDLSALRVSPADAAATTGAKPERFRVGALGSRPVYRFFSEGYWHTVFADSGKPLRALDTDEVMRLIRGFVPEHASTVRHAGHLTEPDQWTIDGGLPSFLPLHRIALGDRDDTYLYVSDRTGEAVMKTTARGRLWGYMGAVLHWTYFTPFRLKPGLWASTIIYASLVGCIMCLTGLAIGIWRYSPFRRFRLKRMRSHSPYAAWMWWHHYAGLAFGLVTFTWSLSGALSLNPWDWAPATAPSAAQAAAVAGGPMRLGDITIPRIREAAARIQESFTPKEFEVLQFRGEPVLMAYRSPDSVTAADLTNPDLRAIVSPQLSIEHRLVFLQKPFGASFTRFDNDAMLAAAREAVPSANIQEAVFLDEYDSYYYDRRKRKPLPTLRVRYDDPQETWLYLDPQHGLISMRYERLSRANRWLYHGFHSLDFPFLYTHRPLWDIVTAGLSIGGIALSLSPMLPALRRLRRRVSDIWHHRLLTRRDQSFRGRVSDAP